MMRSYTATIKLTHEYDSHTVAALTGVVKGFYWVIPCLPSSETNWECAYDLYLDGPEQEELDKVVAEFDPDEHRRKQAMLIVLASVKGKTNISESETAIEAENLYIKMKEKGLFCQNLDKAIEVLGGVNWSL